MMPSAAEPHRVVVGQGSGNPSAECAGQSQPSRGSLLQPGRGEASKAGKAVSRPGEQHSFGLVPPLAGRGELHSLSCLTRP